MILAAEIPVLQTVNLVYEGAIARARVDSGTGQSIEGNVLATKIYKKAAGMVAVVKAVCGTRVPIRYDARGSAVIFKKVQLAFDVLVIGSDVLHTAVCLIDFGARTITFPIEDTAKSTRFDRLWVAAVDHAGHWWVAVVSVS